jgi:3-hydroxy acid dehydrogenase/malonic semialdehyde reductase
MPKLVLITGATSGFGEACARLFAKEGFNLILTGRRKDRLDQLSKFLKDETGVEVTTVVFDVRDKQEVEEKLEALSPDLKNVDILINNAGLSLGLDPINQGSTDDWDIMIDTNVKGLLYVTRVVSNWMVPHKQGHIINLGSIAGKETYLNGNVYCATKYAVDSLSKAMRIDLLQHNIRVTAIHPGAAETEFSEVRFKGDKSRAKSVYDGFEPLVAVDIAEAIWFVVSRPAHVNINEMIIMPSAQANTTHLKRA